MLERAYQGVSAEVDLTNFLALHDIPDDQVLAEVIETDGRIRIAMSRPVQLERYLDAIPDLAQRTDPLDAAIDVVLRARSRSGQPTAEAVRQLVLEHPELEIPIREAAELSNMLVSTDGLQASLRQSRSRELPENFGPPLSDGQERYELRRLLGEGAFGQVYLAVDRHLSEPGHPAMVAIKILHDRGDAETSRRRERLIDEATTARRVDHPNVVRVVDRGESTAGEDYIVYEYVDGGDLAIALADRRQPMSLREVANLVAQIARGVQAAHLAGLVHCDLKPGNIMLTSSGEPKVADFGIAARLDDVASRDGDPDDVTSLPLGNLAFIAPEQFRKEPGATTIPADIFALGGILFLLVTGRLPNGNSIEEIAATHDPATGRDIPPAPSEHRRGVDRDLDLITQRAMAPEALDRYPSAAAFADDLESWLRREPLRWTKPPLGRLVSLWVRRRPALAVAGLGILASLFAAQYFWLEVRHREQERQREVQLVGAFKGVMSKESRKREKHETEMMMATWLLETLYRSDLLAFSSAAGISDLWDIRSDVYRERLDQALEDGRTNDLTTLIRESQLAFWLVRDGRIEEARDRLARNRAEWSALLDADDPWLTSLDVLARCADVKALVQAEPFDTAAAREAAAALEVHRPFLDETSFDAPIHHIAVESLLDVYGAGALDDADALADVQEEIERMNQ